ncbi:guanidino acid hydrolase, mitochondrial [Pholidichthys leucotaenia]
MVMESAVTNFWPFLEAPGEPPVPWPKWFMAFSNYLVALNLGELEKLRARAILVHNLGMGDQRIFNTLGGDNSFDEVVELMVRYFRSPENVIVRHIQFQQHHQRMGESTKRYVVYLRQLAGECQFGALQDKMIQDQLAEHVRCPAARSRLLTSPSKLTLATAIDIAQHFEVVETIARDLSGRSIPTQDEPWVKALTLDPEKEDDVKEEEYASVYEMMSDRRGCCVNTSRKFTEKRYNVPPSAEFVARVSGITTMAKLPYQDSADGLDAAFVGVPIDTGTSNRPGARFGPRQIRAESALLRAYNSGTRAAPYESLMVADIGDVNVNMYDLKDTCKRIREAYRKILATGCIPLTMGGDHTIAYPILQAVAEKHGPVGLVHVDAHADTSDVVLGEKIGHGTPFRRCVEEGLLDCKRVVQIGLRGTGYSPVSFEWSQAQGFRVVQVEECWFKSLAPLMAEVRAQMGSGPVYLSFDIDALDPGFAPGTGTPEIAGLTPIQGVEIIRGCRGLNLVGCDLVEVSPPYDTTGNTALTGANLLFEMLCVLPKIKYY